jgi:hypothetical protein
MRSYEPPQKRHWDAVRKEYKGPLVIAKDLMTIDVDETVKWEGKSSPKGLSSQKRVPSVT